MSIGPKGATSFKAEVRIFYHNEKAPDWLDILHRSRLSHVTVMCVQGMSLGGWCHGLRLTSC